MIEVEKKFILNKEDERRLIKGAEFLNEKVFEDIYYDTSDFVLTCKDKWLRSREGKFELKVPIFDEKTKRVTDQYHELENEQEIKVALSLNDGKGLADNLIENNYLPFCTFKTKRRTYKKENFTIDIDFVDFGGFVYEIAEIELKVKDESEIKNARNQIIEFAKKNRLAVKTIHGKIIEYLKQTKQIHYQALVNAGVIKS